MKVNALMNMLNMPQRDPYHDDIFGQRYAGEKVIEQM